MMPQWDFLDFLREEAQGLSRLPLDMEAPVAGFIEEQGRVVGVRLADGRELRAPLTIAADGRASIVRDDAAARGPRRADGRVLVPGRQEVRAEQSGAARQCRARAGCS